VPRQAEGFAFVARLLWGQGQVIETDGVAGAACVFAGYCELEGIVAGRWERECAVIVGGVALRGRKLIEGSADICAIDGELRNTAGVVFLIRQLDVVGASGGDVDGEGDAVADFGGIEDGAGGVGESTVGKLAERGAGADGGELGSLIDDWIFSGAGAVEGPSDDLLDGG
jgi:hypothetical protein